ncbi:MAG: hypothetical protein H0V12_11125, partial [Chloroflexi bacterium]|nr:hypothetical protein [Chloroflexota bacterium]
DWVHSKNSAIGEYVAESFEHYLAGATTDPAEQDRRLQAFGGALRQALATSRPLVQLDPAANAHFHGVEERGALNVVITPLPFPAGHPARKVVAEVLYGRSEAELERLYDDSNRQRVDITTFLDAPSQPVVFQSLTGPIANEWAQRQVQPDLGGFWQWRRARPLPACVPTAPSMRRAMIRGWFIGRALNHLDVANLPSKPVTVVMEDGTPARFPHPLLGLPIGRLDDVLPAVLESMGIAMVAAPQHALRAYTRLYELGIAKGGTAGSGLAPALNAWIARGAVSRGAAAPDESRAGTADGKRAERADALLGYLAESIEHYQQMVQLDFTDRAVQLPRAWEIAREVVAELVSLQDLIVAARQEVDFSNAIG